MPNIDDSTPINVQLYNETDGAESKKMKFQGENQEEVRSLLEYLYLDVKVRSPTEVSTALFSNLNNFLTDLRAN